MNESFYNYSVHKLPFRWIVCTVLFCTLFPLQESFGQITCSFTEPIEFSNVAAAEPGIVSEILVKEGQHVTAGQVLAKLDQDVLIQAHRLAELRASSKAAMNSAKAIMGLKSSQLENMTQLVDKGHANAFEVDQLLAQFQTAKADFESAQLAYDENQIAVNKIQAEINRRTIRSPINGIVTDIHKNLGEFLSGAEPEFATVVKLDELKVKFYLVSTQINELKENQMVKVTLPNKGVVDATVIFVSPVIDPQSETGRVDVVIANPNLTTQSGITCHWGEFDEGVGTDSNNELIVGKVR